MHAARKKATGTLPCLIFMIAIIAAWQIAADVISMDHILPSPVNIVLTIWELRESLFLHHMPTTLVTIISGWGISITIGFLLASVMHFSEKAEAMLSPVLIVTQTVPVMCISPLFVLWFGYTIYARLIAVVLSTYFSIALNTLDGLKSADVQKKEFMKTLGASKADIYLKLELPSALPKFMTALKMTLPWSVIDAAVAEWLGSTQGLGYFSKRMITKMNGSAVFAPVVILCVISLSGMAVLKVIDKKFINFRNEV